MNKMFFRPACPERRELRRLPATGFFDLSGTPPRTENGPQIEDDLRSASNNAALSQLRLEFAPLPPVLDLGQTIQYCS